MRPQKAKEFLYSKGNEQLGKEEIRKAWKDHFQLYIWDRINKYPE